MGYNDLQILATNNRKQKDDDQPAWECNFNNIVISYETSHVCKQSTFRGFNDEHDFSMNQVGDNIPATSPSSSNRFPFSDAQGSVFCEVKTCWFQGQNLVRERPEKRFYCIFSGPHFGHLVVV